MKNAFIEYLRQKNINDIPTEKKCLDEILQSYWPSLRTISAEEYSASTLQSHRQLLKMSLKNEMNIDIINEMEFSESNIVFDNYTKSLKSKGKGCIKHYKNLDPDDIVKVVTSLNPDDPEELQLFSWFYIQLFFCLRGEENTDRMKKLDLIFETTKDNLEVISLRNNETKNHKELTEDADSGGKIVEEKGSVKCPVRIMKTYLSKLNPENDFLWQKPLNCTKNNPSIKWYANQKVGHNKLGQFMKIISKRCNLSDIYTNHCVRGTLCSILGDLGYDDTNVKAISKHKSISSLALYKRTSFNKKVEMASQINSLAGISGEVSQRPSTSKGLENDFCEDFSENNFFDSLDTLDYLEELNQTAELPNNFLESLDLDLDELEQTFVPLEPEAESETEKCQEATTTTNKPNINITRCVFNFNIKK